MPFEQKIEHHSDRVPKQHASLSERVDWEDDEACDVSESVERTEQGYRLSVEIPSSLFKFILGRRAETKKKIEKETNTQIMVPRQGEEGDIVITGPNRSGVVGARSRIEVIAESSRQKIPFTHFLCFPLYNSDLERKMDEFKVKVLKDCFECRGIDANIFQLPTKIHLTVGMLTLLSVKEVKNATEILTQCYQDLVNKWLHNKPVVVELKGVECMNDDPSEVNVLYAKVLVKDNSDRLQLLANALVDTFVSAGLMKREYDCVKLHATVMNSKLRDDAYGAETSTKSGRGDAAPRFKKRISFDARKVISSFEDFSFGEYHLDTIHLSTRGVFDSQGHYDCATSVPLP